MTMPIAPRQYSVVGKVPEVYKAKDHGLCKIEITEAKVLENLGMLRMTMFLNGIKQELISPLMILLNKVLDDEMVQADRKEANVVPIFKGGQRSAASNYGPGSLTSQICKVFEAVLRDEVLEFLDRYNLIRDSKHGFRKSRSCLANLLLFLISVHMKGFV